MHQHSILDGLNDRQRQAVTIPGGPVLVIAGPGSGKTKCLTHRIAYLIAGGCDPGSILAMTFTNKAAEEMRGRVAALLANTSRLAPHTPPFIGTFHSFAAFVLRREAARIGYRREFTIYDEGDRMALLKEVMKELGVSSQRIAPPVAAAVISNLKNDLVDWEEYEGREAADPFGRTIAKIYETYQKRLRFANAFDFDDLIFHVVRLLRDEEALRQRWQDRYRHIHVDEYQDTNTSQYELVRLLAGNARNLFVIGDDSQAIYGWRRADYRNILNFEADWPEATVVLLEENYRSTPEILAAANHLIAKNKDQKPKRLFTRNRPGEQPGVRAHEDERAEAGFIAEEIAALRRGGLAWSECAVLYRTNAQSRALEEAMLEHDIPYAIVGGIRFFERREVKDLIAYLRYLQNPDDLLALKRIVNVPARGIGPKTFLAYLAANAAGLAPKDRKTIERFEKTMALLRDGMTEKTLAEFLRFLLDTIGYREYLAEISRDGEARVENVEELVSLARRYDAMALGEAVTKLLEEMALASDQDELEAEDDTVKLMTLHSAKGLEFAAVFIAGLEEGLLPHAKSIAGGRAELEEERRLCYVGMTRAKERLWLTWAITRTLFGERQVNMPSRFLRELPEELLTASSALSEDVDVYLVDEA
ncbi:UvrD-helicase domain-containing protein [Candidatus Berkelbacteria bacterium]|nr:UvrD-helicase domain-containing protein [Candidatus Berkelbacteria bacterium]